MGVMLSRLQRAVSLCACVLVPVIAFANPAKKGPERSDSTAASDYAAAYAAEIGTPLDGQMRPVRDAETRAAYLTPIFPSSHAANLLALKNGDLLCFWFSGSWEGQSGVAIVMSRLPAGRSKWTVPVVVDRREGESFQNPVGFEAPDGTVWLFHTTQPAGQGESDSRVLALRSPDQGRTWSSPQVVFSAPGSYVRNPLLVMPNGNWMLPLYHTTAGSAGGATTRTDYSAVAISSDQGKSWKQCEIPNSNGYVQPSVVYDPAHGYIALLRSRFADHIFRSSSKNGCDWSAPAATALPNNNASIQALRLKNGTIVLAFNDTAATLVDGKRRTGARKPLTVAVSNDEGVSWHSLHTLEAGREGVTDMRKVPGREAYSYPAVALGRDGRIYVAYTYRRETIKVVSFLPAWLTGGSAQTGGR
jgi:predicted neuraminidase